MQDFVYIRETDGLTFQNGQIVSSQYYVTISLTSICFWNVKQSFLSILAPCSSTHRQIQITLTLTCAFFRSALRVKFHFPKMTFQQLQTYTDTTIVMGYFHVTQKHKQERGCWGCRDRETQIVRLVQYVLQHFRLFWSPLSSICSLSMGSAKRSESFISVLDLGKRQLPITHFLLLPFPAEEALIEKSNCSSLQTFIAPFKVIQMKKGGFVIRLLGHVLFLYFHGLELFPQTWENNPTQWFWGSILSRLDMLIV